MLRAAILGNGVVAELGITNPAPPAPLPPEAELKPVLLFAQVSNAVRVAKAVPFSSRISANSIFSIN